MISKRSRRPGLALLALMSALGVLAAAALPARELSWKTIDVKAKLDAEGALHVVETQTMVFSGDWNGGERTFRLLGPQTVTLESLTRIDPDGTRHPLAQGGLGAVDEYAWTSENVLRWRSRLPSDPEFSNTELVYEVAYILSKVLLKQGGGYLLDHNFGLPAAGFPIARLSVDLELDPVWRPEGPFPGHWESRGVLPPGSDFTVTVPLKYAGTGTPAAGPASAGPTLRRGLFGVLAAAIVFGWMSWRRRDGALGRFAPETPAERIDARWLEEHLLALAPEEAGALWDEKVGPPEVAAVLARLASEKKIATAAEGKKLTMRLLVPLEKLDGYDRDLLHALFFGGRKETDTEAIKAHYKSTGFDPSSKIKPGLEAKLKTLPDFGDESPKPSRWPAALLFLAGVACWGLAILQGASEPGPIVVRAIAIGFVYLAASAAALAFRNRIVAIDAWSISWLWGPALLLVLTWIGLRGGGSAPLTVVLGTLALQLSAVVSIFNVVRTRNGPKRLARRKDLASARAYFAGELGKASPNLRDEWFPYVVAFGLTSEADHWFRAHGAAGAAAASTATRGSSSSTSSTSSSSSSGGGWTGGGGAFGGAGASGTWAVAAGALASGVASPSSSSSSSGGGGGGGSSGGGGGGGW